MAIQHIISICDENNIKYEHHPERGTLTVQIPKARGYSDVLVTEDLANLVVERDINFLDYKLIEGYEAIWSQKHDCIECEIELPHRGFPFERFFRQNKQVQDDGKLFIDTHINGIKVELSEVTNEFNFIDLYKETNRARTMIRADRFDRRKSFSTSLKLFGLNDF